MINEYIILLDNYHIYFRIKLHHITELDFRIL